MSVRNRSGVGNGFKFSVLCTLQADRHGFARRKLTEHEELNIILSNTVLAFHLLRRSNRTVNKNKK
jgi:hypothetical protein